MALFGLFGKKKAQRALRCRDMGMDCAAVITGATDEEVLQKAAAHATTVHKMQATPEMAAQMKRLIMAA
ncbi:MAG: DUF1059 domain-containing protein [Chloroflexi bacterium]|nr:DUF1059 domain-containing protein [Chloroflexota bacterium]